MNVRQIVLAHLKLIGADGLCAEECGCGLDDFMPCGGDRNVSECKPAMRRDCDGTCNGCLSEGTNDRADSCYRPAETTNEPEETHL